MAVFDVLDSEVTRKNVPRAFEEYALQSFVSDGSSPYGFDALEVKKRGNSSKKKLVRKAGQDEIERLMFELYRKGDGSSGPLDVKKITEWLNDHG